MSRNRKQHDEVDSTIDSARAYAIHVGPLAPRVCLHFVNSLDSRLTTHPQESITHYATLVSWSQRAGVLAKDAVQSLTQQATLRPTAAAKAVMRAIALREALYRIFSAVAGQRSPQT